MNETSPTPSMNMDEVRSTIDGLHADETIRSRGESHSNGREWSEDSYQLHGGDVSRGEEKHGDGVRRGLGATDVGERHKVSIEDSRGRTDVDASTEVGSTEYYTNKYVTRVERELPGGEQYRHQFKDTKRAGELITALATKRAVRKVNEKTPP